MEKEMIHEIAVKIKSRRKKSLVGKVWTGFIGEYKKPPIYIIHQSCFSCCRIIEEATFIDDFLRPFLKKKVRVTISELEGK